MAIESFESSLHIDREIGNRRGEIFALGYLGNIYSLFANYSEAIDNYSIALKISRELGDRINEGTYLFYLAKTYIWWGKTNKAIEYYEQAIPIYEELNSPNTGILRKLLSIAQDSNSQ